MRVASALVLLILAVPSAPPAAGTTAMEGPPDASGLAGTLLVAEPELTDPNFDHTLILMLHHDAGGAMGLVLNRVYGMAPTGQLLRRLGIDDTEVEGETRLFYGGPVQPEIGMIVHSADYKRPDTKLLSPEIAVTSDPSVLADIARGRGPRQAMVVLGYAGWGPGQLESELAQGAWFTLPVDPQLVFSSEPARAWAAAFARKGVDL